jgi:hypothetical protein
MGDRSRPRTWVTAPGSDLQGGDSEGGEGGEGGEGPHSSRRNTLLPTVGHRASVGSGVARTPAPCPAPSWSAEAAAPDCPEPLLQRLLTRTARSQAPRHLRDPHHGQEKQQRMSQ